MTTSSEYAQEALIVSEDEAEGGGLRDRLADAGAPFAVVVNAEGLPLCTVDGSETRGIALLMPEDATMESVVSSEVLLAELNAGAHGVLLTAEDRPVGVIPADSIRAYLQSDFPLAVSQLGDDTMPGDPVQGALAIPCKKCGLLNIVAAFLEGRTPCENGHPLER